MEKLKQLNIKTLEYALSVYVIAEKFYLLQKSVEIIQV